MRKMRVSVQTKGEIDGLCLNTSFLKPESSWTLLEIDKFVSCWTLQWDDRNVSSFPSDFGEVHDLQTQFSRTSLGNSRMQLLKIERKQKRFTTQIKIHIACPK